MTDSPPRARLDPIDRTHGTPQPRIIHQDTAMGIQQPPDTYDNAWDVIQLNGDMIDFGETGPGPGANDRYTPEAAQAWTDALIDIGYRNRIQAQPPFMFSPEWFKAQPMELEPSHVRSQLDGIARMSFGSPGKPRRR